MKLNPVPMILTFIGVTGGLAFAVSRMPSYPVLPAVGDTAHMIQLILIGILAIQQVHLNRLLGWKPALVFGVLLFAVWLAVLVHTVRPEFPAALIEGTAALSAVLLGTRPIGKRHWVYLAAAMAGATVVSLAPPIWHPVVDAAGMVLLLISAYHLAGSVGMVRSLQLPFMLLATADALGVIWGASHAVDLAQAIIRAIAYAGLILSSYHQVVPALQDTANAYLAIGMDLGSLLSALDEVFFVARPDNTLLYVSDVARRYGLVPEKLRGRKWSDLATATQPPPVIHEYPRQPVFALRHQQTGELFWMEENARLTQADGRGYVVGTLSDITRRIALEERLLESTRLAAVGELSAGIAHNFNNLLASVSVRAEHVALLTARNEDSTLKINLEAILSSVNRGAELTRALLTFARGEPVELRPVRLAQPVLDAMEQVGTDPRIRSLQIEVHVPDDLAVLAHAAHVQQVVVNLLLNAGQAVQAGGRVTITGWQEGNLVCLAVRDNGVGIQAEHLRRIFEPFFTTRRESGRGTGLGLSVSLGMMRSMGGDLRAESRPGEGSTFTAVLQAASGRHSEGGQAQ